MKAVIVMCLTEMITKKFGENKLKQIFDHASISHTDRHFFATMDSPDEKVLAIFSSTCHCLNLSLHEVGELFGEYWCQEYVKNLYEAYFKSVTCAKDFLLKMKRIHGAVTQKMPNAKPPNFDYIDDAPDHLVMKYQSDRNLQAIWLGCIKGVGIIFNEKLDIDIIDENTVGITFSPL